MERVGALINKLKEQYEQSVDKNNLLVTAQLLLSELQQHQPETVEKKKVSVILPKVQQIVQQVREEVKLEQIVPEMPQEKSEPVVEEIKEQQPALVEELIKYAKQATQHFPEPKNTVPQKEQPNGWLFETAEDIPTLTHQKDVYELNDVHINEESLNDKLKEERVEDVASTLYDAPVRDLRKAIGINDRYRFINELFRGDETMYERSIKTINGFNILPEAEYWIQRELKVKMGWSDETEAVKIFDQVVRRRFS